MHNPYRVFATALLLLATATAQEPPRSPLPARYEDSAESAWLAKPVYERRTLDDMSDARTWALAGPGQLTVKNGIARVAVNIHNPQPGAAARNTLPTVTLKRAFPGEDWSRFNRLSFWVRPDMSGFPVFPAMAILRNGGKVKIPAANRDGTNHITLVNHQWTHVVWEIEALARDRVTSVELNYWVNKRLPDPGDAVSFEIRKLELERVDPEPYEGWTVAPGRFAFSHTGYATGAAKTALASDLAAEEFTVVRTDTGQTVLRQPVQRRKTSLGSFEELDFSAIRDAGTYRIEAGGTRTPPFRVEDDVWAGTIRKTVNFFFAERCGFAVPGIHGVCHRDWFATQGGRKIVMNGGWHDAGDLSQGLINTGEATYAMYALAQKLAARGGDPALLANLLDEARWGLAWLLKVRFDGGYRIGFASHNTWTNGLPGDSDDRSREALNNPNVNYIAAAAEAIAAQVLRDREPDLAARSLRIAEDDWRYAIAGQETPATQSTPAFAASEMELASVGILASLELYRATGGERYAQKALELAPIVVASQQRSFAGTAFPLAGFFYTSPKRDRIFHQFHRGNDQAPLVALARLCEAFPNHRNWMEWYSAVALYAEYQKASVRATEPYGVLPAYVYHESEAALVEKGDRYGATPDEFREQVRGGMPMGGGYYLKTFPVWFTRRGNYGVLLSQAKGLSTAAQLRRDPAAAALAERQLEWVVGRNPFAQSTMWGEGYGFAQQYSVSSGDIVGSLPVGMMTRGNRDAPYWPPFSGYVYKEVWVHSSARWLWLMQDLAGPADVAGQVRPGGGARVEFEEAASGRVHTASVDAAGRFRIALPAGGYQVRAQDERTTLTALPGGVHTLDLCPGRALDFSLAQETDAAGNVTLRLTAKGSGKHSFALRTTNVELGEAEKTVALRAGVPGTLTWKGRMKALDGPWVAVAIPDGELGARKEAVGSRAANR
jgi:hypothetical protein